MAVCISSAASKHPSMTSSDGSADLGHSCNVNTSNSTIG